MITKKNIYHYLLYVVFALIFFCGIGLHSISLAGGSTEGNVFVPMLFKYGIVFVAAAVIILVYKFCFPLIPEKYLPKKIPLIPKFVEAIGAALIVIFMLFFRIMIITSRIGSDEEINNVYLNFATGVSDTLPNTAMLTYVYAVICKLLCNIHPSEYPLYAFNTLLQIGTAFISYFSLKRTLKMRYGILVFLLIAFLPYSIYSALVISPDIFLTFLFAVYFYVLARITELNEKHKFNEKKQLLFMVLLGVISGFITSLDIIGVSLMFITISMFFLIKNSEAWLKFQKPFTQSFIYFISYAAATFSFLYTLNNHGIRYINNCENFIYSFIPDGLSLSFNPPCEGRIEGIVIFIFAAIAIFSFIRNDFDKGLIGVWVIDLCAIFTFVNFNSSEYSYLVNFAYFLIVAVGLFSVPDFLVTQDEIYEREKEKKRKEAERQRKEFERNQKNHTGINLAESRYNGKDVPDPDEEKAKKKEETTKVVGAAPSVPPAYETARAQREIISIGYNHSKQTSHKDEKSNDDSDIDMSTISRNSSGILGTETITVTGANAETSDKTQTENTETAVADTKANETVSEEISTAESVSFEDTEEKSAYEKSYSETGAVVRTYSGSNAFSSSEDTSGGSTSESEAETVSFETDKADDNESEKREVASNGINGELDSDITKRDKVRPSRKDYKTAHVYKSKEEEEMHSMRMNTEEITLTVDPELKATPMIKNPLPTPKAHVPKELTYDYELKDDELEFDIEDLKGKDYYDI